MSYFLLFSLCDPIDYSMPGFLVLHHLPELAQTHVHWVSDAIQPPHPLSFPSPPILGYQVLPDQWPVDWRIKNQPWKISGNSWSSWITCCLDSNYLWEFSQEWSCSESQKLPLRVVWGEEKQIAASFNLCTPRKMLRHGRIGHTEGYIRNPSWAKVSDLNGVLGRSLLAYTYTLQINERAQRWDHRGPKPVSKSKRTDQGQLHHCPWFQGWTLRVEGS